MDLTPQGTPKIASAVFFLFLLFSTAATGSAPAQDVVINELMAANRQTLADDQGQFDDWVELYNPTSRAVDLAGWTLTDDLERPAKWRFPTGHKALTTVPAGGWLLVWVDDDEDDPGLHAGFNLAADGELLALLRPDLTPVDQVVYGRQAADVSWGRYPDGQESWQAMADPTPGRANRPGVLGRVEEVRFSVTRGFFHEPFSVSLSCPTEEAEIWFSLDFTTPHERHVNARGGVSYDGQRYSGPIEVTTTTCIRAVAIKPGWQDSPVVSQSYLFLDDILRQPSRPEGFPADWNGSSPDYAMDSRIVQDSDYAGEIEQDLLAIPSMCIVIPNEDFFGQRGLYANGQATGDAWERVANLEWIDPNTGAHFGTLAGLRSHGGVGRSAVKHSLRAIFRSRIGPSKLEFPLFPDSDIDVFDQLILRAQWNYSWVGDSTACGGLGTGESQYLRETFARDTALDLGILTPHARHVHLYVNGLYWGVYILSERPDAGFAAEHLGGDKDDYDVLKASNSFSSAGMEVKAGDIAAWEEMFARAAADLRSDTARQALEAVVDVNALVDYMLMIYTIGSRDAPVLLCNDRLPRNFWAIRPREPGGRFVFIPWDCEWSLERLWENRVDVVGVENPHVLMNQLSANEEFRVLLADRIYRRFFNDGALTAERNIARYLRRADEIEGPVVGESARWGDVKRRNRPYTRDRDWIRARDRLVEDYFPERSDIVLEQLRDAGWVPPVDPPVFKINGVERSGGRVESGQRLSFVLASGSAQTYYTLDGRDPRLPGGAVAPTAMKAAGSLALTRSVTVKARARRNDGRWSALHEAVFVVGDLAGSLRVCEIMAHPLDPNAEFIELTNIGPEPVNLAGVHFTDGVELTFGDFVLAPNATAVAVADPTAFTAAYGHREAVVGTYQGRLNDGGERIVLRDVAGNVIQDFVFDPRWFADAAGYGRSLVVRDARGDAALWSEPWGWRVSAAGGGNPGVRESTTTAGRPGPVVISEVMYHPYSHPDAEYVELTHVGSQTVTLYDAVRRRGWRLHEAGNDGVQFTFQAGQSIRLAPGRRVLLVKDPTVFEAVYGPPPANVVVYAWGDGKLGNGGETLTLSRPVDDDPAHNELIDQVRYSDGMHGDAFTGGRDRWPLQADGMGAALERLRLDGPGSDPGNWQAVEPSPGS